MTLDNRVPVFKLVSADRVPSKNCSRLEIASVAEHLVFLRSAKTLVWCNMAVMRIFPSSFLRCRHALATKRSGANLTKWSNDDMKP